MITWNVIRDIDAPKLITMSCSDRDTSLKRYVDMKLIWRDSPRRSGRHNIKSNKFWLHSPPQLLHSFHMGTVTHIHIIPFTSLLLSLITITAHLHWCGSSIHSWLWSKRDWDQIKRKHIHLTDCHWRQKGRSCTSTLSLCLLPTCLKRWELVGFRFISIIPYVLGRLIQIFVCICLLFNER